MHCLKSSSPSPSAKIQQNSLGSEFHLMIARPFTSARDTSLLQVSNEATDTDGDFSPNTSKIPRLKVVQSTPKSASYSHDCECSMHGNRAETQRQNETPKENDKNAGRPLWYLTRHTAAILFLQGIFLLLFIIFVRYGEAADASHGLNNHYPIMGGSVPGDNPSLRLHHNVLGTVVMLVGLGMRVSGAPGHLLSGVGWTLLLAGLALQWAVLCRGFLDGDDNPVDLDVTRVLEAELVSIGTCIAQGAVVGVASPLQMLVLMMVHVPLHLLNHHLAFTVFKSVDLGGCVSIHVFGSVFGMATSRALSRHSPDTSPKPSSASQVTALVGTVVVVVSMVEMWLWRTTGDDHNRALVNTFLSLAAAVPTSFVVSSVAHPRRKFSVSDVQSGMLGAAVAVSAVVNLMLLPYGALLLGAVVGAACVLARCYLTPLAERRLGVGDVFGVGVAHGLAGVLGGVVGVVMAVCATDDGIYGYSVYDIYPAMAPRKEDYKFKEVTSYYMASPGEGRSAPVQAAHQLASLLAALALALVSGTLTGLVLRLPGCGDATQRDSRYWQLPAHIHTHSHVHAHTCRHHHHAQHHHTRHHSPPQPLTHHSLHHHQLNPTHGHHHHHIPRLSTPLSRPPPSQ